MSLAIFSSEGAPSIRVTLLNLSEAEAAALARDRGGMYNRFQLLYTRAEVQG